MAGTDQVSVGTVATLLAAAPAGVSVAGPVGWFAFANGTVATVYVGGSTAVTTSTGYALATSAVLTGYLFQGDSLYGIVASGTAAVDVLQTGA